MATTNDNQNDHTASTTSAIEDVSDMFKTAGQNRVSNDEKFIARANMNDCASFGVFVVRPTLVNKEDEKAVAGYLMLENVEKLRDLVARRFGLFESHYRHHEVCLCPSPPAILICC